MRHRKYYRIPFNQFFVGVCLVLCSTLAFACDFTQVKFVSDFEGARLNGCSQIDDTHYSITIDAENRPVNPSPWYAFKVLSKVSADASLHSGEQQITLVLDMVDAKPRYLPKISMDGKHWQAIPFELKNGNMHVPVTLSEQAMWIAAQPLILNQDYEQWQQQIVKGSPNITLSKLGDSTQGRPIWAMTHQQTTNKEWIVIIGRQHPPELTGAFALKAFIEGLFSAESQQQQADFFNRFNVLVVPNLNPDGVALGNWRHSSTGKDLNRDWHEFQEVETTLVRDEIKRVLGDSGKLVFALDFHSTQQDVFYTMPSDYHVAPALLADEWLAQIKAQTVSSFTVRNRPGSSPGRGIFKQYIADTYNVHAVTYEMGDNTPEDLINHVANVAATTMMSTLVSTPAQAFEYSEPLAKP
jgi:hypothetical protein